MLLNKALPFCRGLQEFWYAGSGMTNGPMRDLNLAHHASLASGSSWERNAVKFNGSTGYAEAVAPAFMGAGYGDGTKLTASALIWVAAYPSAGQYAALVQANGFSSATDCYGLWIDSAGKPNFQWHTTGGNTYGTTAYNDFTAATVIPVGEWTHVVGRRDGTSVRLFVNGILDANSGTADSNPYFATTTTTRIGGLQKSGQTRTLNGYIRMASIHARAMGDAEVKAYADEARRGFPRLILRNNQ